MKKSKLLLVAMLILPWLTVPLLGKNTLKKYWPASIFISVFTKYLDVFGERNRWWKFYKGIWPFNSMDFLNLGPYLVSSLWMLKATYGKFFLYLVANTLLHILFIFIGLNYLKQIKILSLVNLTKIRYLFIHISRAILLYGFEYLKERAGTFMKKKNKFNNENLQILK
ncbi:hypothetical protein ACE38V_01665 [Cytobacillus sp. Hz8]|uniref:hypothetical protein n=1 Tax=Cytobacillus sp. Hz8 TaxID=3347168 RepID=UPI0035D7CB44